MVRENIHTPTIATLEKGTSKKKKELSLVNVYLLAYNSIQFVGWTTIFCLCLLNINEKKRLDTIWKDVEMWVKVFQTAAVLEVVHSAIGMIKSNPLMTLVQLYSRVFVVWGIISPVREAQMSIGIACLLCAWTITEMIRYSFYFLNLLSQVPSFLTWCRYTFFFVLYPMGVMGEILCMYSILPFLKSSQMWSIDLPNRVNVSFNYYYYVMLVMVMYIPVFPQLYFYMIAQRKKVLGSQKKID